MRGGKRERRVERRKEGEMEGVRKEKVEEGRRDEGGGEEGRGEV